MARRKRFIIEFSKKYATKEELGTEFSIERVDDAYKLGSYLNDTFRIIEYGYDGKNHFILDITEGKPPYILDHVDSVFGHLIKIPSPN
jgi:hypothetical protein